MAIVGISITKQVSFRDSVQPFSNAYFYNNGLGGAPNVTQAEAMLDELIAIEKTFHSTQVTFTFGRIWLQGLTEAGSVMIFQKSLVGAGTATTMANFDKERAYLFRWLAGQDSRGNPVYLRKWYHSCGLFPGSAITSSVLENITAMSSASRTAMAGNAADVESLSAGGGGWALCAKSGRGRTGPATPEAHRYLEHRQLGDQWRGA